MSVLWGLASQKCMLWVFFRLWSYFQVNLLVLFYLFIFFPPFEVLFCSALKGFVAVLVAVV